MTSIYSLTFIYVLLRGLWVDLIDSHHIHLSWKTFPNKSRPTVNIKCASTEAGWWEVGMGLKQNSCSWDTWFQCIWERNHENQQRSASKLNDSIDLYGHTSVRSYLANTHLFKIQNKQKKKNCLQPIILVFRIETELFPVSWSQIEVILEVSGTWLI